MPITLFRAVLLAALMLGTPGLAWAAGSDQPAATVRPSILAGTWYDASGEVLSRQVKEFLNAAKPPAGNPGALVALVVPHAGYAYSGPTAGFGYARLAKEPFTTAIVVGPSHRSRFPGVAVDPRPYQTPLGTAAVDQNLVRRIQESGGDMVQSDPRVFDVEHCLEIQVPFLQTIRPGVRIVPILMGSMDLETCRALGRILADIGRDPGVRLICSTDLSHFLTDKEAEAMDGELAALVKKMDPEALHRALSEGKVEACGGGPLVAVMMAAKALGAGRADVLALAHSGQATGDQSSVVGYMSAALVRGRAGDETEKTASPPGSGVSSGGAKPSSAPGSGASGSVGTPPREPAVGVDLGLGVDDQKRLLKIARESIQAAFDRKDYKPTGLTPGLKANRGAFVTLKKKGELRGCIGRLSDDAAVAETVAETAVLSAFEDTRFPPLAVEELAEVRIEISVLTPFEEVKKIEDIRIGDHGLMIVRPPFRGLLLPQVPVEEKWTRDEFLAHLCRKAGLPPETWKEPGTQLFSFSAQVFGEKE
jgi:AmmeMemoRadiSam system protein B/AmmeMemoRadiSam system protein A